MNLLQEAPVANHGGGESLKYVKNPLSFEKLEFAEMQEPPLLGEHTDEILGDLLKYSKRRISDLRSRKII